MEPTSRNKAGIAHDMGLLDRLERLHPAVVADALDKVGVRTNVMIPTVRPLFPEARLAGYAFTVQAVEVDAVPADPADNYREEIRAVDALTVGDVMVVSSVGQSFWGELLATAAGSRGARGIVVDGYTRDARTLIDMRFPTFVTGIQCQDSLGRVEVASFGSRIHCGGVAVSPQDLVLADLDGVVVIPSELAEDVISIAESKVADESRMRAQLAGGMAVTDAFRKHRIL